jgi:hypothetical protein
MEKYIKWLENKIEVCLEDKDLQREHWAFCQALKKYRELALTIPAVVGRSEQFSCGRNITTCVFYKNGGKCSNLEYCKDQTT